MAINYKRLLKLADFLDKLPRSHFDFNTILEKVEPSRKNKCGTVGCAIGWCPTVFPRVCEVVSNPGEQMEVAPIGREPDFWSNYGTHAAAGSHIFGITEGEAYGLFTPSEDSPANGKRLRGDATPKQVARRIRTYVAWSRKNPGRHLK